MSVYEFQISFSYILFFIERIRRARKIASLSGPYVSNIALMARDSIRMNLIRLHSAIALGDDYKALREQFSWVEFNKLRNDLAHEIDEPSEEMSMHAVEIIVPKIEAFVLHALGVNINSV